MANLQRLNGVLMPAFLPIASFVRTAESLISLPAAGIVRTAPTGRDFVSGTFFVQYDFDSATVIGFLRKYGLDKDFKLNIEANHATLAQHTFQHELRVARTNGMFGSIDANQGDPLLGWDTDQFPTNVYDAALCMYEVLKAGGFTNGGLNFDAKARRGSFELEDIFHSYIAGMDTFALGLRIADKMITDGRLDSFVADRYASWKTGIGADIIAGKATMADLEKYALEKGEVTDSLTSGRQEMLEAIMNDIMFTL